MSPPPPSSVDDSTVNNYVSLAPPVSYGQKRAFAAIGAICLVLGLGAATVRILTSRRVAEKSTARDLTYGLSMVLFTAFICATIAMFSFGDEFNVMAYAGASVASVVFYTGALAFLRIAALCLYQDTIFKHARYSRFTIGLLLFVSVYSVVFVVADSLQCKPNTIPTEFGRCINISDLEIVIGIFDFVTLSIILAMPAKTLWQGRKSPNRKNSVYYSIAFTLGFFACAISLVHAVAPAAALWTWSLMYPLTGLLTLTLIILAFAITDIPALLRPRAGPTASPTSTPAPQEQNSRSASALSWLAEKIPYGRQSAEMQADFEDDTRHNSAETFPTPEQLEEMSELYGDVPGPIRTSVEEHDPPMPPSIAEEKTETKAPDNDGRSNSMRSFTRLGSLTGAVKPPSFMQNRTGSLTNSIKAPSFIANRGNRSRNDSLTQDVDVSGITIKTEVQMSYEARRNRRSLAVSRSESPPKKAEAIEKAESVA